MKEEMKVLLEDIRSIKNRLDDMDMSLEKDRERMQDFAIRLENVETEIKETRQAVNRMVERVQNRVAEVVEPAIESNAQLEKEVKKKKMVFVREKKNWWEFWRG
jgi:HAMP domain-containing protein